MGEQMEFPKTKLDITVKKWQEVFPKNKVLRENGISTSAAVRALWQELATTRTLPGFLEGITRESSEREAKKLALGSLVGVAQGSLSSLSDEELEAVGMARYE